MGMFSIKKKAAILLILSVVIFVAGMYLVINSVSLGTEQLNRMITELGHSLEQTEINLFLSAYIRNMQIVGISLISFGGIGIFLLGEKMTKL